MALNIATIKIHKIGTVRILCSAKGNVSVDVITESLKSSYKLFFKIAKRNGYNFTESNVAFVFDWEK